MADLAQALESDEEVTENTDTSQSLGPWILIITNDGYGKRVPVTQFRLQNRAGMGIVATKFKKASDRLAALHIVNDGDELMMVTNRGIIIRQAVSAIPSQSRPATGVRVQRLDEDDAIAAVALVPPSTGDEASIEESTNGDAPVDGS